VNDELDVAGSDDRVARLLDKQDIRDALHRYSRGIDRGEWDLVRSAYHSDAYDDHGPYKGDVPGLISWLDDRFADVEDSTHFLGQTLVEFTRPHSAFVETYFLSRRLLVPTPEQRATLGSEDMMCREVWGRYADEFERRDGRWAVSRRVVVIDARYTTPAFDATRPDDGRTTWGLRNPSDAVLSRSPDREPRADTG
jgi:hypothetical protein